MMLSIFERVNLKLENKVAHLKSDIQKYKRSLSALEANRRDLINECTSLEAEIRIYKSQPSSKPQNELTGLDDSKAAPLASTERVTLTEHTVKQTRHKGTDETCTLEDAPQMKCKLTETPTYLEIPTYQRFNKPRKKAYESDPDYIPTNEKDKKMLKPKRKNRVVADKTKFFKKQQKRRSQKPTRREIQDFKLKNITWFLKFGVGPDGKSLYDDDNNELLRSSEI